MLVSIAVGEQQSRNSRGMANALYTSATRRHSRGSVPTPSIAVATPGFESRPSTRNHGGPDSRTLADNDARLLEVAEHGQELRSSPLPCPLALRIRRNFRLSMRIRQSLVPHSMKLDRRGSARQNWPKRGCLPTVIAISRDRSTWQHPTTRNCIAGTVH